MSAFETTVKSVEALAGQISIDSVVRSLSAARSVRGRGQFDDGLDGYFGLSNLVSDIEKKVIAVATVHASSRAVGSPQRGAAADVWDETASASALAAKDEFFTRWGQYSLALEMLIDAARDLARDPHGEDAQFQADWLQDKTDSAIKASDVLAVMYRLFAPQLTDARHESFDQVEGFSSRMVQSILSNPKVMLERLSGIRIALENGISQRGLNEFDGAPAYQASKVAFVEGGGEEAAEYERPRMSS